MTAVPTLGSVANHLVRPRQRDLSRPQALANRTMKCVDLIVRRTKTQIASSQEVCTSPCCSASRPPSQPLRSRLSLSESLTPSPGPHSDCPGRRRRGHGRVRGASPPGSRRERQEGDGQVLQPGAERLDNTGSDLCASGETGLLVVCAGRQGVPVDPQQSLLTSTEYQTHRMLCSVSKNARCVPRSTSLFWQTRTPGCARHQMTPWTAWCAGAALKLYDQRAQLSLNTSFTSGWMRNYQVVIIQRVLQLWAAREIGKQPPGVAVDGQVSVAPFSGPKP